MAFTKYKKKDSKRIQDQNSFLPSHRKPFLVLGKASHESSEELSGALASHLRGSEAAGNTFTYAASSSAHIPKWLALWFLDYAIADVNCVW